MSKIALVGSQYTSRSLAASAQSCVNLNVELIEVAIEPAISGIGTQLEGKNRAVLYGAPGRHVLPALRRQRNACGAAAGDCFPPMA